MNNLLRLLSLLILPFLLTACAASEKQKEDEPMVIIFETDMGNDIDDALALDMLYKYQDQGVVTLLAIMNNKDSAFSAEYIDILNTWYGYPNIPIGKLQNGVTIDDYVNYAQNVCNLVVDGAPMFKRTLSRYDELLDAHLLYRKTLAGQPDRSVTIISVGFSTNLARLLDTPADQYSPLTGAELVELKVKSLAVMGGSFGEKARAEFNIINDIPSAQKLFNEWPGEIVLSPFELGAMVQFPAKVIENNFDWGVRHPMVEGYLHYRPMPYNRATWDLTSVLYAVDSANSHFEISEPGMVSVDDLGYTLFVPQEDGKHFTLSADKADAEAIKQYLVDLISQKPANIGK